MTIRNPILLPCLAQAHYRKKKIKYTGNNNFRLKSVQYFFLASGHYALTSGRARCTPDLRVVRLIYCCSWRSHSSMPVWEIFPTLLLSFICIQKLAVWRFMLAAGWNCKTIRIWVFAIPGNRIWNATQQPTRHELVKDTFFSTHDRVLEKKVQVT